jgi:bifunctional ADP-heptose synthase (sugar kinase/adenylyltransferase)
MFISVKNGDQLHLKTTPRNIVDVSGAGDAVISIATLMDIEGCNLGFTTFISNLAGGIVCEEVGVVPINKEKLKLFDHKKTKFECWFFDAFSESS